MLEFTVRIIFRHVDVASTINKQMNKPTVSMVYVRNIEQADKIRNALLANIPPDLRFSKYLYSKRLGFVHDGACPVIHIVAINQPLNDCYSQGSGRG